MAKTHVTLSIDELIMLKVKSRRELKGKLSIYVENFLKSLVSDDNNIIEEQAIIDKIQELETEQGRIHNELTLHKIRLENLKEKQEEEHDKQLKHKKDMLKALRNGGMLDDQFE